jgi:hypothetical protein
VIVGLALNVAMVKSQLLCHRQAVHHSSVDQSLGEGVLGIAERLLTFDIGLPTGALGVEDDWVNIDWRAPSATSATRVGRQSASTR